MLDFAPFIASAVSSGLSFAGAGIVTLFGIFPSDALPESNFMKNGSVPALFDDKI